MKIERQKFSIFGNSGNKVVWVKVKKLYTNSMLGFFGCENREFK